MNEQSPSRTALRVALRRAAHQVVDLPPLVFPDPFATKIIGSQAAAELTRTPAAERKPFSAAMRLSYIPSTIPPAIIPKGQLHKTIIQSVARGAIDPALTSIRSHRLHHEFLDLFSVSMRVTSS